MKQSHNRTIAYLIGCLGLLSIVPTVGATDIGQWTRTTTPHFVILSQSGYEVGHRLGADLERLHHVLTTLTDSPGPESPRPTYFYVFRDEASLAPYRQPGSNRSSPVDPVSRMEVIGGAPNAGYLVPHEHGNYAVVVGGGEFVPTRYVYKQYIHHRLHEENHYLPHWFRQGVAEYYSSFRTEGELAVLGLPSEEQLQWIRRRAGDLLPAADLMAIDQASIAQLAQAHRQTYFRQSWALFHYLLQRDRATQEQQIVRYVGKIAAGVPPAEAFEEAFSLDLDTVSSELEAYLAEGKLTYLKIAARRLDLLILKTVDLGPHEAEYHLGDLMARAVRGGALGAAKHFARALELEPDFGPAWAGMGYLAQSAGDHEAALQHYEKAVTHDPDNYLSSLLYGKSLLRTLDGQRPADEAGEQVLQQAIDALQRSVELNDGLAEAWADLGYAYGLQTEASDAGVEALRRALGFFPERADLSLNLLLAHARRGERTEADAAFAHMGSSGADAQAISRAREILLQMDFREAARKARQGHTDEAIAQFAHVQAETQDPGLKETAEQQIDKLSMAGDLREFFDLYNQAAAAINNGETSTAHQLVDRLAAQAEAPWQVSQVERLRGILAKN